MHLYTYARGIAENSLELTVPTPRETNSALGSDQIEGYRLC
jgi:hypothetical protein